MDRKEWLKSLKIGDEVCYDAGKYGSSFYVITRVDKITPAGKIRTADEILFNLDGENSVDKYFPYVLQPVTDEVREAGERRIIIDIIGRVKFDKLETAKLREIINIIKR